MRPGLKVGICGEHGGEPSSVEFCHQIDQNYVSCSPFRVPIARLAAARAALADATPGKSAAQEKARLTRLACCLPVEAFRAVSWPDALQDVE